ncbi:MAG: cache domain-containing protein, partial [Treponema sp.]|nr:cache domain-containing protein [Treponema sp.]
MKKIKPHKISTLNKVIIITLLSVSVVFVLQVIIAGRILISGSRNAARNLYAVQVNRISDSIKNSMDYISSFMNFAKQSFSVLNPKSKNADQLASDNLQAMLDISPNIYSAWLVLEKGRFYEDDYYIRDLVKYNGTAVELDRNHLQNDLNNPGNAQWFFNPMSTGEKYFMDVHRCDYGNGSAPVYAATLSVPIKSGGETIGVCGVDIVFYNMNGLAEIHKENQS